MTAAALLTELRRRGVEVWADGDRLCYRAPRGALTPELREAVRAHKGELLAVLRSDRPRFWPLEAWQEEWGWVSVRDPCTGIVHQIRWRDCPQWLRRRAQEG
ncbi:hypothetical protein E1B22_03775 [Thermaerobacter sp. FW80]|uniref:TubC N-terminal docking domain-related protein n=1 Tax=Thermaerobacter sp. FW80 TaxID=2546351 RepID=UPI00107510AB|nr:hypothetical protein [Thermaerobacter sp. FW80]QBS37116.1 hypothetical protein E1B22_03775 [Thermaerobacter sp. FW80]